MTKETKVKKRTVRKEKYGKGVHSACNKSELCSKEEHCHSPSAGSGRGLAHLLFKEMMQRSLGSDLKKKKKDQHRPL